MTDATKRLHAETECARAMGNMNAARSEKSRARWERVAQRWLDRLNEIEGKGEAPATIAVDAPKRGRGRPPLAPGESKARETWLKVRASRAELERWEAAAGGSGELSDWVRERLDEAAERETR